MDRRTFLKLGSGVAGAGALAGCTSNITGGAGGGESGPIRIGGLEPLSGGFSPWGGAHVPGINFAIEEINADGGVLGGRELEFVQEDTAGDPGEADTIFRRLVEQEDIVAATGPVNSDVGVRTAQTAQSVETPLFLHMSGSNAVIKSNTTYTYRVGLLPATNIMRSQAQLVADRDIETVGALIGDFAWGRSIESAINDSFPVDTQIEVAPVSASDFISQLRQFPDEMDLFIATGHPPGQITITQQLFELGKSADIITGSGFPLSVLAGALGEQVTQGLVMYHLNDLSSSAYQDVARRYGEETGQYLDPNTAYGYVTGKLIAAGLEEAGEASREALNEAMKSIEFDTIYTNPIQYTENGELDAQVNNFSRINLSPPDYAAEANAGIEQFFSSQTLDAIPADLD
jgi:ABC-type branched-subunit amino acid transport system substrate-binding protein